VLELLISTACGRFHFITAQGRHLFKEATFTVSTLPRAWLQPPPESEYIPFAVVEVLYQLIAGMYLNRVALVYTMLNGRLRFSYKERFFVKTGVTGTFKRIII